jgi:hypothetical protein
MVLGLQLVPCRGRPWHRPSVEGGRRCPVHGDVLDTPWRLCGGMAPYLLNAYLMGGWTGRKTAGHATSRHGLHSRYGDYKTRRRAGLEPHPTELSTVSKSGKDVGTRPISYSATAPDCLTNFVCFSNSFMKNSGATSGPLPITTIPCAASASWTCLFARDTFVAA